VLILSAILSAIFDHWVDFWIIIVIVLINSIIGFSQEYRAERAVSALAQKILVKTKVYRDGHLEEHNAKDLVPGDIIILEEGDKVPADARLIEAVELQTIESALTGESQPTQKSLEIITKEVVSPAIETLGEDLTEKGGKMIQHATQALMNTLEEIPGPGTILGIIRTLTNLINMAKEGTAIGEQFLQTTNEVKSKLNAKKGEFDSLVSSFTNLMNMPLDMSVDGLNELTNMATQHVSKQATRLSNAMNTGTNMLNTGSNMLNTGSNMLNTGSNMLNTGSNMLNTGANMFNNGPNMLNTGFNTGANMLNTGFNTGTNMLNTGSNMLNTGFNNGFNSGFNSGFNTNFNNGFNTNFNNGFNTNQNNGFNTNQNNQSNMNNLNTVGNIVGGRLSNTLSEFIKPTKIQNGGGITKKHHIFSRSMTKKLY
jgi:magnesium-transporting ATPase (P-type)